MKEAQKIKSSAENKVIAKQNVNQQTHLLRHLMKLILLQFGDFHLFLELR